MEKINVIDFSLDVRVTTDAKLDKDQSHSFFLNVPMVLSNLISAINRHKVRDRPFGRFRTLFVRLPFGVTQGGQHTDSVHLTVFYFI